MTANAFADDEPATPPPPWTIKLKWGGYVDIGAFGTTGDGAGHIQDTAHTIFPQFSDVAWVFHGDPLATAANSRGEPADTGGASSASRAITIDSINSNGKPTFLINEVNLDLTTALHPKVWLMASMDFMPRSKSNGVNLGDLAEIDLAFANWTMHDGEHVIDLQAGKFDSVMGVEYRIQESPDRFGITPSLIFRYTSGHPVGLKMRAKLWEDRVNVAVALTNGSHFIELFPFSDEQDSNTVKTGAARVAVRHEGEDLTLEVGASGLTGAQDQQPFDDVAQWQVGGDAVITWKDFELRAEYVRGRARGKTELVPCDLAPCLRFQGAYGELAYRVTNTLGLMTRVDWRDADHRAGNEFVYVSDVMRTTVAARFEIDRFAILKAEYVHGIELFDRPKIANDVVTSSLVLFW